MLEENLRKALFNPQSLKLDLTGEVSLIFDPASVRFADAPPPPPPPTMTPTRGCFSSGIK
jgi:hypothetical protein